MAIRTGPLGYTFTALRTIEFMLMVVIVGTSAALCARINRFDVSQPVAPLVAVIIGALGAIYTITTLLLHISGVVIRYIISTILDLILCMALIVTAIYLGRPLADLSCSTVEAYNSGPDFPNGLTHLDDLISRYSSTDRGELPNSLKLHYIRHGFPGLKSVGGLETPGYTIEEVRESLGNYYQWVARTGHWCRVMKATWACSMVATILTLVTAVVAWRIWKKATGIPWVRGADEVEDDDMGVRDGVSVREEVEVPTADLGEWGVGRGGRMVTEMVQK